MDPAVESGTGAGRTEMYQVEELTPAVVLEVAERVAVATSFADLIYRESEIDALWSLADIAARTAAVRGGADAAAWADIRERIGTAHDLVPEGQVAEAAEVLRATAALL